MAGITHDKVLTGSDGTNPNRAQPSDWNADHVLPDPLDLTGDLNVDTIDESTTDAGVTVEGVLLKDSAINFGDEDLTEYDEGEWTPTYSWSTSDGDFAYGTSANVGQYTRIGNRVFCQCTTTFSSFSHSTASGNFLIGGLPFTRAAGYEGNGIVIVPGYNDADIVQMLLRVTHLATTAQILALKNNAGLAVVNNNDIPTGSTPRVYASFSYEV